MLNRLIACRVADAFRTRLGISGWDRVDGYGPDNSYPTPGNRYMFHARKGSGELARHGIHSLTLVIALPLIVRADIVLEASGIALTVNPNRVVFHADMEPFGRLVYRSLTESEIAEMRRECKPFRLVMEALEEAEEQLKAEAQKEDAE